MFTKLSTNTNHQTKIPIPPCYSTMKFFILLAIVYLAAAKLNEITVIDSNSIDNLESYIHIKKKYSPDWSDLDSRPLPEWYDKAKIGIFIHWGVYCVPSYGSEWFWASLKANGSNNKYQDFMENNYPPGFTYQEFAPMFTAEFFDPDAWAALFAKAGAKYVVLTSKHHEGFTLFPSKKSFSWNSVEVGPRRDIVKDLSVAVRNHSLKFGVYHSLYEWYNPIYLEDKRSKFKTRTFTNTKLWPDIMQLVNDYKPSVIWADGDWEAHDDYWRSQELLAWLYNESPVKDEVVVNDRWGIGIPGKHGDFYNYADRYNPGKLLKHKWENAFTLDRQSWGYRRDIRIDQVLSITQLLYQVVSTVSCGGNALINVGPTKEGTIIPIFQERLLMLGEWLSINGEAIYGSSPWFHQNDTLNGNVWYTCQKSSYDGTNIATPTAISKDQNVLAFYAIILKWPKGNLLRLKDAVPADQETFKIVMLGDEGEELVWAVKHDAVEIQLPDLATVKSKHAWTLKFTYE